MTTGLVSFIGTIVLAILLVSPVTKLVIQSTSLDDKLMSALESLSHPSFRARMIPCIIPILTRSLHARMNLSATKTTSLPPMTNCSTAQTARQKS
jgi:hypothetical protein